jgi:hypothetical protein
MGFMTGKSLQQAKRINLAKLISAKKGILIEEVGLNRYELKGKYDQYTVSIADNGEYTYRDIYGDTGDIFDFLQKQYGCTKNEASDLIKDNDFFKDIDECTHEYRNDNYSPVLDEQKEYSEAVKSMHKNGDDMTNDELENLLKFLGGEK